MKRTQRERNRYWDKWFDDATRHGVPRLRRRRGRPRGMSQGLWFWITPDRDPDKSARQIGWSGGRHRAKPWRYSWVLHMSGTWLGSVQRYRTDGPWVGQVHVPDSYRCVEREFSRRCDAKRWVEAEAARRAR